MVVVFIVGVLLALVIPGLRAARASARSTLCSTRISQQGVILALYTGDFRNYYPIWISDGQRTESNPEWWPLYSTQAMSLLRSDRWLEYAKLAPTSPQLFCPDNVPVTQGVRWIPDYVGVASMHADATYLNPESPTGAWVGKFGGRAQRIDSVLFPDAKAGLFELYPWHLWNKGFGEGQDLTGLPFDSTTGPTKVWFFDGHVQGLKYSDAKESVNRNPNWGSSRLVLTAYGVLGRDR